MDLSPPEIGGEDRLVVELLLALARNAAHGLQDPGLEINQRSDHVECEYFKVAEWHGSGCLRNYGNRSEVGQHDNRVLGVEAGGSPARHDRIVLPTSADRHSSSLPGTAHAYYDFMSMTICIVAG